MKEALDKEGLKPHLMIQPICYHTPDSDGNGFAYLPETPFGELAVSIHFQYCRTDAYGLGGRIQEELASQLSPHCNFGVNLCSVRFIAVIVQC